MRLSILKVLAYFDLFSYPVSPEEIRFFLDQELPQAELQPWLDRLVTEKVIFRLQSFYSLQDNPLLAARRLKGNHHAGELLRIAEKGSRILFQFPFVTGIGISGSLSKHYAAPDADIDYFIITRANRLWIARTFMHLFKKLTFLTGRQHWYCMNYYIDEEALEIEEKNIFTATELITLLPACGNGSLTRFFDANDWVQGWLPQYRNRTRTAPVQTPAGWLKRNLERLFDNRFGDKLDDFFRRLTTRRWQKKEASGKLTDHGFRMSLKNDKHFSRPNPEMMQKKILGNYQEKLAGLSTLSGEN